MTTTIDEIRIDLPTPTPVVQEDFMRSWDGTELFYRVWQPAQAPARKALILLHRGHEHSGRFADLVEQLALEDTLVAAWDARGHGRSPGERGYAESFSHLIKDADAFLRYISRRHDIPIENIVILGHSVSAVLVAAWVHDYAPPIRGMILATPAFDVKLYVPLALPALRLKHNIFCGRSFVTSYIRPNMLTHDPEQAARYANDPLISKQIAVNILIDLFDTSRRIVADAGAITTPTLILTAGSDWVVKNKSQAEFFRKLSSAIKQMHLYPGFRHAIFHEQDRHLPIAAVRDFVTNLFRQSLQQTSLTQADRVGVMHDEYERLRRQLPLLSPRRLNFALQKLILKSVARLSEGVRLGWKTGFNSGQSLDHVYRNEARGITPLGKLIDRIYLNAIGWRGIRQRKVHLEQFLIEAMKKTQSDGQRVHILDIAAGPGRYVLDTLSKRRDIDASARLQDCNPDALAQGRQNADAMGLKNVEFVQADAFDADALSQISPKPTSAIVSGLYELFPDNDCVARSLHGLSRALGGGGYLIYTNQPWHPQLEMIARVLTHGDGRPWIMRRRSQAEMDQLVRAAGFEKIAMEIDRWGIFTVSLARRVVA